MGKLVPVIIMCIVHKFKLLTMGDSFQSTISAFMLGLP